MVTLLLVLLPIALLDSVAPLLFVVLLSVLSGRQPRRRAALFIAGQFLTYFLVGLAVMFGLRAAFVALNELGESLWVVPETPDLIFQIVIGAALAFFGMRRLLGRAKPPTQKPRATEAAVSSGLWRAFTLGVVSMAAMIPLNFIYFAAIDQILKADLSPVPSALALLFYNLLFSLPLFAIYGMVTMHGERGLAALGVLRHKLGRWSPVAIGALMAFGGVFLIVDGVGWFLGRPLVPV